MPVLGKLLVFLRNSIAVPIWKPPILSANCQKIVRKCIFLLNPVPSVISGLWHVRRPCMYVFAYSTIPAPPFSTYSGMERWLRYPSSIAPAWKVNWADAFLMRIALSVFRLCSSVRMTRCSMATHVHNAWHHYSD